jgi:DNA-binding NarL/FixJ family response regulator
MNLTEREKEILVYISKGYTDEQISKELSLSKHTVKAQVKDILQKLKARNRIHLAYRNALSKR